MKLCHRCTRHFSVIHVCATHLDCDVTSLVRLKRPSRPPQQAISYLSAWPAQRHFDYVHRRMEPHVGFCLLERTKGAGRHVASSERAVRRCAIQVRAKIGSPLPKTCKRFPRRANVSHCQIKAIFTSAAQLIDTRRLIDIGISEIVDLGLHNHHESNP